MILSEIVNSPAGELPFEEVSFHPNSFGDPAGRIFQWRGKMYRGIRPEWAPFYEGLFKDGTIQSLVEQALLIPSELTQLSLAGFDLVVSHSRVPFPSYVHEWCAAMLKDAALTLLGLAAEVSSLNLTLKDPHPWNVLFIDCNPVYVDLTSIVPTTVDLNWLWYDEFCRYTLYPLLLFANGQERTARWLLWDYDGIHAADVHSSIRRRAAVHLARLNLHKLSAEISGFQTNRPVFKQGLGMARALFPKKWNPKQAWQDFLLHLRREVEDIALPNPPPGNPGQEKDFARPATSREAGEADQLALSALLDRMQPASLLDIGSHSGWRSRLAASKGIQTVAFDANPAHATQLYHDARKGGLPILPLVMDFSRPTPSYGLAQHGFVAADERFQCDLVLAFSLVHHLVFQRGLTFEQIAEGLGKFSKRWLVVEFVPQDDEEVLARWPDRQVLDYRLDNLVQELDKRFHKVRIQPAPSEGRAWLICERN